TLYDEIYSRLGEKYEVIKQYEKAIAEGDEKLIEQAIARMDAVDGWSVEQRIKQVLSSMKLTRLDQRMGELSGGEAKRAAIALMLLQEADFLVMDEPTNHLDIEVIEYLESHLQKARCTLLMVTHDRYFLDRVCNTIYELDRGQLYIYKGNYSDFLEKREERYTNMQANIDKARNLLRRELEWIRSTPQARTGKARYRINAFYDLKDRASESLGRKDVTINIGSSRLGGKIIDCEGVSLNFGERRMLDDFTYKFSRYERVGIVGKNGVGKSTFLNLMTGDLMADKGTVERGETLRIGYYRQSGIRFKPGQRVIDVVREIAETARTADGESISITSMLTKFLFPVEDQNKLVEILSGGEQRRLYLLTVLMQNPNFLILDEPTNDLDILTLNVLEDYLLSFKGCLLIVSHDRYFLDKIVDHLFIIREGGHVKDFVGQYSEYREYIKEQEAEEARQAKIAAEKEQRKNATLANQAPTTPTAPRKKLSYKEQRELEALEQEIPQLEQEKGELEEKLSSGALSHEELNAASERIGELMALLEEKEMRWLELSEI
ncbi:MAG: ATP-binding cassette domain-containing protein, partial [Alistipes sp.]|nr:ATP-binding cassette domain-containing protein [Alistipes sp.]